MSTLPTEALVTLARGLLRAYRTLEDTVGRPKDRQIAKAHLNGMCDAAHRIGIGMTPDAVYLATMDATRESPARPTPAVTSPRMMADVKDHDAAQAERLAVMLDNL